jgi:predicted acetyltransferase
MRDIAAVSQTACQGHCEKNRCDELHLSNPLRRCLDGLQEHARASAFGIVARPYSGRQARSYTMNEDRTYAASVEVAPANPGHALLIQNFLQLYTHDFSEFWTGTLRGDVNSDGRFDAYPLDSYWSRPNWAAYLISCDRKLAGFALLNDETHSGRAANRNMGEFFILRKYRGNGVGRVAAELLFSRHAGSWEVAVARKNTGALRFWRSVICSAPKSSAIEELDLQNSHWNGPILRFDWATM